MSHVDTKLTPDERDAFLDEVRTQLPAFLSSDAAEIADPVGDVGELLNLSAGDLRKVVAVHLGLSDQVRAFLAGLRAGLRQPLTSSERPRVATQAVRGPIDWGSTIRHRALVGGDTSVFVVRPAQRVFDIPENRALVWLLVGLDRALRRVSTAQMDPTAGVHDPGWIAELATTRARLQQAQRFHWLRGIPAQRPDAWTMQSLLAARTRFYKQLIPDALRLLQRLTEDPSGHDITELLCRRYFEPGRDWQLFEIIVALRLARGLAQVSTGKRRARLLIGSGRTAFARYLMPDGDEVSLWYQSWPLDIGGSRHEAARERYSIDSGPARPDLVVERRRQGTTVDAVLLELKASRSASTLGAGLLQLLGYLKDRPDQFTKRPCGWLVAPASPAFISTDSGDLELWALSADDAAHALVDRCTS